MTIVCPRCKTSDEVDKAAINYAVFMNGDSQHHCGRCGMGFLVPSPSKRSERP